MAGRPKSACKACTWRKTSRQEVLAWRICHTQPQKVRPRAEDAAAGVRAARGLFEEGVRQGRAKGLLNLTEGRAAQRVNGPAQAGAPRRQPGPPGGKERRMHVQYYYWQMI